MRSLFSLQDRSAGLLLAVTSLPGRYGCGDLGEGARQFADFLRAAGQRWWQMLPIGPIGAGDSPYSSNSAFAGNGLLIDLEGLRRWGLLMGNELIPPAGFSQRRVRYGLCGRFRDSRLRLAYERFGRGSSKRRGAYEQFCEEHRQWLEDYGLFCALKQSLEGQSWSRWPRGLRLREAGALEEARRGLEEEIGYQRFVQYVFDQQWDKFKRYCNRRGVGLIGDVPIFLDYDSCDVWAHRELYWLNGRGQPRAVSGVPPDAFCKTGQKWGHPLYDWREHEKGGFVWWTARFRGAMRRFDAVRIDHFLGFARCWAVPRGAATAQKGRWIASPGSELFEQVERQLGPLPVIAEDLGVVTPEAIALRDRFGFLGMRVVQNGFGTDARNIDLPHNYPRNCVAYTGTHDNDTIVGWFPPRNPRRPRPRKPRKPRNPRKGKSEASRIRQQVLNYTGTNGKQIHWDLMRVLNLSAANLVIVPMQDVLGLDSRHRMNIPGVPRGQWRWRVLSRELRGQLAERLQELAAVYGRVCER